jgi:asparagine synthase (glutamine-hydrolysing)
MCGISGLIFKSPRTEPDLRQGIAALTDSLAHRGPDGEGIWLDAERGIAFGQRRLAIIDLSDAGAQPMVSASGALVLTYNGEIYNFRALRTKLQALGHVFKGYSDSEVLLEHWDRFGADATLAAISGMYAIAVHDRRDGSLTLARDPFGIKPLCYHDGPACFAFASELRSLRQAPGLVPETDPAAVIDLLTLGYVAAPRSILACIAKLEPGHVLRRERDGAITIRPFHRVSEAFRQPVATSLSFEQAVDQVEARLVASVEAQLVSDVPLGSFLSGGIDSSLVTALAHQASGNMHSFTIGFDEARWDESPFAEAVARHLGTRHETFRVNGRMALDLASEMAAIYDEPFADSSQIPTLMLCRMVRQAVTVALSGDGGDEAFSGYQRYDWGLKLARYRQMFPGPVRKLFAAAGQGMPPNLSGLGESRKWHRALALGAAGSFPESYRGLLAVHPSPLDLIRPELRSQRQSVMAYEESSTDFITDTITRMRAIDSLSYLPDDILVKVDRASMACGLEVRVPLLDLDLWHLSATLPAALHRQGGRGKAILRAILGRHVPAQLMDRPKAGFAVPLADWLRGPLMAFMNDLLNSRRLDHHPVLAAGAVRALRDAHLGGKVNHAPALWAVLMLLAHEERGFAPRVT